MGAFFSRRRGGMDAPTLAALRRNDPDVGYTYVFLNLEHYTNESLSDAVEALEMSSFVNDLDVDFIGASPDLHLDRLVHFVETSHILENTYMCNLQSLTASDQMLRAIQENSVIRSVAFEGMSLSVERLSSLVNSTTSITELQFDDCDFQPYGHGMEELADSFGRNTSIRFLGLSGRECDIHDDFFPALLDGLSTHSSRIRDLSVFCPSMDAAAAIANAVKRVLQTCGNMKRLQLDWFDFEFETLRSIAQGTQRSTSVSDLYFCSCSFSPSCIQAFGTLAASGITSFTMNAVSFEDDEVERSFFDALLGPESTLTSFRIERWTRETLEALMRNIPKMKRLKNLYVGKVHSAPDQSNLMLALKKNRSLRKVQAVNLFSSNDKSKLACYSSRNETLDQMTANPKSVPRCTWPSVLATTNQLDNGTDVVFRFLLEAGELVG